MSERFTLITARTREQGQALHQGKGSPAYEDATAWIELGAQDMARLRIAEGELVHVRTEAGQADLPVRAGALPDGVVFIPSGPVANRLGSSDTEGTGMPLLKGLRIDIARCLPAPRQSPREPS